MIFLFQFFDWTISTKTSFKLPRNQFQPKFFMFGVKVVNTFAILFGNLKDKSNSVLGVTHQNFFLVISMILCPKE